MACVVYFCVWAQYLKTASGCQHYFVFFLNTLRTSPSDVAQKVCYSNTPWFSCSRDALYVARYVVIDRRMSEMDFEGKDFFVFFAQGICRLHFHQVFSSIRAVATA
jgi:hypothetical protein